MGRSYGEKGTGARTARLVVRMTPEELEAVREAAASRGCTMGAYVRTAATAAGAVDDLNDERTLQRELMTEIRRMRGDLGRLGNNVNQIARVLNTTGLSASAEGWEVLRPLLTSMEARLLKLSERIGKGGK